ncbi:unnamed protein product [Camellia sinensis]
MSGQFTESCRTLKGANRNQCRDSLQSLVGPLKKSHPQKVRPIFKRRAIKKRAQSIKRRAIKRRAQFIKRCAGHDGEARRRLGLRARLSAGGKRRAMRVAASAIRPRQRLRLRHTILKPLKPTLSLKNSASSERETVEHFVAQKNGFVFPRAAHPLSRPQRVNERENWCGGTGNSTKRPGVYSVELSDAVCGAKNGSAVGCGGQSVYFEGMCGKHDGGHKFVEPAAE